MQTVAPLYPKRAISQTMKSEGRSVLQYNAKQDLILISKNFFSYSCNLDAFCGKGKAIPQIKFGFFLAFKQSVWPFSGLFLALFGFLLKFSTGDPVCATSVQFAIFCVIFVSVQNRSRIIILSRLKINENL